MPFNQSLAIASGFLICFLSGMLAMAGTGSVDTLEYPVPAAKPYVINVQEYCALRDMDIELKRITVKDLTNE